MNREKDSVACLEEAFASFSGFPCMKDCVGVNTFRSLGREVKHNGTDGNEKRVLVT